MGRDDVGIIYQLNVVPIRQRGLIGASLIKEVFARAAYGCRLFCCWCAQDIQANYFWESIGFVPLAFRTGSRSKQRIHIFWQRRVREDDKGPGATPYWFPSQTRAGAISEDRLVLPIPPGTHWRDAKPLVLPGVPEGQAVPAEVENTSPAVPGKPLLPAQTPNRPPAASVARKMAIVRSQSRHLKGLPPGKAAILTAGGIRYVERGDYVPEAEPAAPSPEVEETAAKKPKRTAKPRVKNDPKYVAAARELRDRYLEQVNGPDGERLLLTQTTATPKYDVSRLLGGGAGATVEVTEVKPPPQLPAA